MKVKGIEIFTKISKDLRHTGFDGFEINPCKVVNGEENFPNKMQCIEQCEPHEAQFWSVYVHLFGAGLDCIADCETEQEAKDLVEFLKALIVFYKGEK
ncbi:MAG TPA: hypothetical protein VIJ57_10110 [Hanamia sp.]